MAGIDRAASSAGVTVLFELKAARLWPINGGYRAGQFTLYGRIRGLIGAEPSNDDT